MEKIKAHPLYHAALGIPEAGSLGALQSPSWLPIAYPGLPSSKGEGKGGERGERAREAIIYLFNTLLDGHDHVVDMNNLTGTTIREIVGWHPSQKIPRIDLHKSSKSDILGNYTVKNG